MFYIDDKDFETEYMLRGAYHYKSQGFSEWFLRTNYQLIAKMVNGSKIILDLGCGEGRLKAFLPSNAFYVGIDSSGTAVRLARNFGDSKKTFPIIGTMLSIPFPDHSFDTVVSSLSIQYLDIENLPLLFSEVNRVLAENGKFVFSHINPAHRLHSEHIKVQREKGNYLHSVLDIKSMIRLLEIYGFKVKRVVGTNLPHRINNIPKRFRYFVFEIARISGYFLPFKSYHYVLLAYSA